MLLFHVWHLRLQATQKKVLFDFANGTESSRAEPLGKKRIFVYFIPRCLSLLFEFFFLFRFCDHIFSLLHVDFSTVSSLSYSRPLTFASHSA